MKNSLTFFILLSALFTACNKGNSSNGNDQPGTTVDTTKIFTLVSYNYNNGHIEDSIIKTLTTTEKDGFKKYILTEIYSDSPGDSDFTIYKLNAQNQLIEVFYYGSPDPSDNEKDTYVWQGDNLSQIQNDSSGVIQHSYNFNYNNVGANTRITFTEQPQKNNDTFFNGGNVQYFDQFKTALIVSSSDFKPLNIESEAYFYIRNDPSKPPTVGWDTIITKFALSATGDLQQKISISSRSDTNSNSNIGEIHRYNDSLIYNYTRENFLNDSFSIVLQNIYGKKLFILSNYFYNEFLSNDLLPEGYDENFFSNVPLKKSTSNEYKWEDGIPGDLNGQMNEESDYQNTYDNKNRLIMSVKLDGTPQRQPESGFRIIWP
ncbi:MAG: hypothetical protein ABI267_01445 [Ginsengibacter sp.]